MNCCCAQWLENGRRWGSDGPVALWGGRRVRSSAANVNQSARYGVETNANDDSFYTSAKLKSSVEPKRLSTRVPIVIHMHSYT